VETGVFDREELHPGARVSGPALVLETTSATVIAPGWSAEVDGVRLRVDTYLQSGRRIPFHYDSMVCKLIVSGTDRERARLGMLEALRNFRVEGVKTTIPLHEKILADKRFASGTYDTALVGHLLDENRTVTETAPRSRAR